MGHSTKSTLERGAESELAHKWARWLHHPCRLGGPHRFRAGGRIRIGPKVGKLATSTLLPRGSPPLQSGAQNQNWPTSGQGTSPLPPRRSPPLQSGGHHQNWPTSGQGGYITPAAWGVPTASERGDRIRSGPQMGKVATSPLPPGGGGGALQSGGQKENWPTSGQGGYINPAE